MACIQGIGHEMGTKLVSCGAFQQRDRINHRLRRRSFVDEKKLENPKLFLKPTQNLHPLDSLIEEPTFFHPSNSNARAPEPPVCSSRICDRAKTFTHPHENVGTYGHFWE